MEKQDVVVHPNAAVWEGKRKKPTPQLTGKLGKLALA